MTCWGHKSQPRKLWDLSPRLRLESHAAVALPPCLGGLPGDLGLERQPSLPTQPRVSSRSSAADGSFTMEPGGSVSSSGLGPRTV